MFKNWIVKHILYTHKDLKECYECKKHYMSSYIHNNLCIYCEQINIRIDSFINERKWK